MKVHIGPYRRWIGTYQIVDFFFFWLKIEKIKGPVEDSFFERWDYKLRDKIADRLADSWLQDFCSWIDKFKKRKIKVKIDYYDTWSMDHTLAMIIHPMLIQLKETNHGYGHIQDTDAPEEMKDIQDRWNWAMDEMIWAFNEIANDEENAPNIYSSTAKEREAYYNRIRRGTTLFGKYYQSLWD